MIWFNFFSRTNPLSERLNGEGVDVTAFTLLGEGVDVTAFCCFPLAGKSLPRQLTKASLGAKLIESVYGVSYRIRGF